MLARAIGLTLGQIDEPAFWKTLLKSLLLSVPLFAVLIWLGLEGVEAIPETGWLWGGVDWLIDALGGIGVVFAALLLFPALATMVMGNFLDDIAEAVNGGGVARYWAAGDYYQLNGPDVSDAELLFGDLRPIAEREADASYIYDARVDERDILRYLEEMREGAAERLIESLAHAAGAE